MHLSQYYLLCIIASLLHTYTRKHARTHARTHTHTHSHTNTHTHKTQHTHRGFVQSIPIKNNTEIHTRIVIPIYTYKYIYIYRPTHIRMYIQTVKIIHIRIRTCKFIFVQSTYTQNYINTYICTHIQLKICLKKFISKYQQF